MYYAIQDTNIGFIQWLGEAQNEVAALEAFRVTLGGDATEAAFTELTQAQYARLDARVSEYGGDDQDAIDMLESFKNA